MTAFASESRAVVVLLALAGFGLTAGAASLSAQTKKVLVIGIDGVRTDVMAEVATPNIDALVAGGAWSMKARTTIPTISGPSWSSMLIGAWPEKHRVFNNDFSGNRYAEYPDFLTRIESVRPELNTFAAADWMPLVWQDSGGPLFTADVDAIYAVDGYEVGWPAGDSLVTAATTAVLSGTAMANPSVGAWSGPSADPDVLFAYLGNPDETSHRTASIGEEYRAAIELADRHVGQLVTAVRARPTYDDEDWLILISTDHGRRTNGGHGGRSEVELTSFFIAHGPSAVPGEIAGTPRVLDIAVTALTHMGIEIDPAWDLDGRPVGIAPATGSETAGSDAGSGAGGSNAPLGPLTGWLAGAEPLELEASDGTTIYGEMHGDLTNARALLLLFHQGGANARGEYERIIPRLIRNGYAAIAVDARAGGGLFDEPNRTRAAFADEPHYCEAYPDLIAVLDHARALTAAASRDSDGPAGDRELPIVAWGSSYSAALVLRLGGENDDLAAVLAFSPAGGEPMGECPANRFADDVAVPTFVFRPRSEADIPAVAEQMERFDAFGFSVHVAEPGLHGSSMLDPSRVDGDVEPTWALVLDFLGRTTSRR